MPDGTGLGSTTLKTMSSPKRTARQDARARKGGQSSRSVMEWRGIGAMAGLPSTVVRARSGRSQTSTPCPHLLPIRRSTTARLQPLAGQHLARPVEPLLVGARADLAQNHAGFGLHLVGFKVEGIGAQ